ncbi:MAG TPA: ChaN family lipoprotein, partial [Hyphomicrobiales bacterium]|nr:ChaN family lipoprotein [Hyphomicrobiales bacterium]
MRPFSYPIRYPPRSGVRSLPGLLALLAVLVLSAPRPQAHETADLSPEEMTPACRTAGGWVDVASGEAYDRRVLFRDLAAENSVVLLGESHDKVDHHRWQLHTLAALHGRVEELVIGFESFPRRVQPVLDDWVAGDLTAEAFLETVEWEKVWGFDPGLYMPLFQFARLHKVPMVALNVERGLVSRVGEEGWAAIPEAEREGVSDPAPASEAYERRLVHVYVMERPAAGGEPGDGGAPHGGMAGTPHGG